MWNIVLASCQDEGAMITLLLAGNQKLRHSLFSQISTKPIFLKRSICPKACSGDIFDLQISNQCVL